MYNRCEQISLTEHAFHYGLFNSCITDQLPCPLLIILLFNVYISFFSLIYTHSVPILCTQFPLVSSIKFSQNSTIHVIFTSKIFAGPATFSKKISNWKFESKLNKSFWSSFKLFDILDSLSSAECAWQHACMHVGRRNSPRPLT